VQLLSRIVECKSKGSETTTTEVLGLNQTVKATAVLLHCAHYAPSEFRFAVLKLDWHVTRSGREVSPLRPFSIKNLSELLKQKISNP
jgi:hypothetical protein